METLSQIHFTAPYWELLLPCIGAGADIVTGWLQATINGTWDSTKMRRGLYRKIGEIMVVVLAWVVGVKLPCHPVKSMVGTLWMLIATSWGLTIRENLSQLMENPQLNKSA